MATAADASTGPSALCSLVLPRPERQRSGFPPRPAPPHPADDSGPARSDRQQAPRQALLTKPSPQMPPSGGHPSGTRWGQRCGIIAALSSVAPSKMAS